MSFDCTVILLFFSYEIKVLFVPNLFFIPAAQFVGVNLLFEQGLYMTVIGHNNRGRNQEKAVKSTKKAVLRVRFFCRTKKE